MNGSRRVFLRSACGHCAALAGLGAAWGAAAQETGTGTFKMPGRFSRPATDTDEGGLWSLMDREESRLRRSPLAVRDAALTAYLTGLVRKLAPDHSPDIRVYVMRTPYFNATMAPNGMMQVWSGLLLRVENEAQLATILGHELGHYLERHAVEQLRDAKDKAVLAQLVGLVGGWAGAAGKIGILASLFAFSREHERRADEAGMRMLIDAGYDGREAPKVWENLLGELKITGGESIGERSQLFATHPPTGHRRDDLRRLAGSGGGSVAAADLRRAIAPLRFGWLHDEIKRGQYEESLVLFDRMLALEPDDAEVRYARGEVYRLRGDGEDLQRAADDLTRATLAARGPADTWRSLGLVEKQRARGGAAVAAFEKYLSMAPDAPEAGMVRAYIAELKP